MKKVFICSRYRADENHTVEDNVRRALFACTYAATKGYAPYVPHLYLTRCLDDNDPNEREAGMAIGREFLAVCDEVWQWGATVSAGMAAELAYAEELGIPIKVFNSVGVPRERWHPENPCSSCENAGWETMARVAACNCCDNHENYIPKNMKTASPATTHFHNEVQRNE